MTRQTERYLKSPVNGFYQQYGGAYIPELLAPQIDELQKSYTDIIYAPEFRDEFYAILKSYAGRPTPLYFAERLSQKYGFPVYLKREDLNHTGSHKLNNVVGQILLAQKLGKRNIIAETGAGQHGVATATVCAKLGMPCKVFMGEIDVQRQQPNVRRMKMLGAEVIPVSSGSKTLKDATNEALRYWIQHPDTYYLLGSAVGPHPYPEMVASFQSVISEELMLQIKENSIQHLYAIIACVGGGSNAIGAFYHFIDQEDVKLIGVEAAGEGIHTTRTAATLSKGKPGIFHGFKSYVLQDNDGQIQEAHSVSAGLDYPGVGPIHAYLKDSGRAIYRAVTDEEALQAAIECSRLEGIIPALESAHALAYLKNIRAGEKDAVIVNLSGRGDKDMETYLNYLSI